MARYLNTNSNTSNQSHWLSNKAPQASVLASCYSVSTSTSAIHGFHYYTTTGAGLKTSTSPPFDISASLEMESNRLSNALTGNKGEATHTIPGECERLFCDKLAAIFLGEGRFARQELLGVDAYQIQPIITAHKQSQIQKWVEVMDYSNDRIYRGFVADTGGEYTLFIFFEEGVSGQGLKTGLIALFELAILSEFVCSQIVACIPRSQAAPELEVVRNLGWCGFNLITLQPWMAENNIDASISDKWLFLSAEFLLPPTVFHSQHCNAGRSSAVNAPVEGWLMNEGYQKYLSGHVSYIRCLRCAIDLCLTSQIVSKGFTGRHGRAYLVSADPVVMNTGSSLVDTLPNTIMQKPVSRQLVTGAHTVSDISCAFCGNVLGWKYVAAEEESQRYKVGKFILETKRIMTSSSWESTSFVESSLLPEPSNLGVTEVSHGSVEFDSEDEDECEDLFTGVWSPGLAIRRRSRKLDRRPSIFGLSS
ncbi:yippee zinc-binding/DNA-binding /Mis18, centromere assembly-domain-containing protein [Aspergillus avenaceus]|uniref:Yippee zinc-binding/DNA-binding /Mis18, centromere assembly-domain-containing protein n=1 Tax=Aspergillus avenaceus TaxID=36643 RepID=A0A5N6TIW0_ASPAV|nr:yippee zinc-binding/DNA-binding /Mis18, centromere assembly-domain-containing protein [Aspergillus avenaceus]